MLETNKLKKKNVKKKHHLVEHKVVWHVHQLTTQNKACVYTSMRSHLLKR